jgi:hypothetical protein
MSLHIYYDHQCPGCGAQYIPYDRVPCPRCGLIEADRSDFISRAVLSLLANKRDHGSYTPRGWAVPSFGDQVVRLLFLLYDAYEHQAEGQVLERYCTEWLTECVQWDDAEHLRDHVRDIALRVWGDLQEQNVERPNAAALVEDAQPLVVTPYRQDWVLCPNCGKRFSLHNPASWTGKRHLTCGQRLDIKGAV